MAPILIYAEDAEAIAAEIRAARPEEAVHPASTLAAVEAALAAGPEVAFTIRGPGCPVEGHARILAHPTLRWFHAGGSGVEHLGRWDARRVRVTNSVGVLAPFLAESCVGALLALNHQLIAYRDQQRERLWRPRLFRPLAGQTLLVVGAGAIGGEVSARAAALGMRVIALRRSGAPVPGAAELRPPEALDDSLGEADAVSVHLRLTPETEGLFDAARFARMRPGALFLNTARGGHVVEEDLVAALASGHLGGAYLDVTRVEPLPPQSPLWDAPNLLLSPHNSDGVEDWLARFTGLFLANLAAWRAGRPLANPVDPA